MKLSELPAHVRDRVKMQLPVKGLAPRRGRMNKTEMEYRDSLEAARLAGEVLGYEFETLKLRLADGAWYCPDFVVFRADGDIQCVEVKGGFVREASMVRLKVAAERFRFFEFVLAQKKDGEWSSKGIGGP